MVKILHSVLLKGSYATLGKLRINLRNDAEDGSCSVGMG
jgi:hypothetical protein